MYNLLKPGEAITHNSLSFPIHFNDENPKCDNSYTICFCSFKVYSAARLVTSTSHTVRTVVCIFPCVVININIDNSINNIFDSPLSVGHAEMFHPWYRNVWCSGLSLVLLALCMCVSPPRAWMIPVLISLHPFLLPSSPASFSSLFTDVSHTDILFRSWANDVLNDDLKWLFVFMRSVISDLPVSVCVCVCMMPPLMTQSWSLSQGSICLEANPIPGLIWLAFVRLNNLRRGLKSVLL